MALSANQAEAERQAAADLAMKLKFEAAFARDLRVFFRGIRRDFATLYIAAGTNITTRDYQPDLVAILRKNYRKIARAFGGQLVAQINKAFEVELTKQEEEEDGMSAAAIVALGAAAAEITRRRINDRANKQSGFILRTTQSEYDGALAAAVGKALSEGTLQNRPATAKEVTTSLTPRQNSRADVIATTETNGVAERAKQTEANVVAASAVVIGGVAVRNNMVKVWNAVLDEVTRIPHASADGQVRRLDEPFLVNRESLMHPGDTSLGASAGNVINCRCSSQFMFKGAL